mmetsp:Transcript_8029/g.16920  ORF Transcript_8029/g.16920 Transcript_8029/m.16920 type:complete len:300 (+) Transcript_8029:1420-2319(+)
MLARELWSARRRRRARRMRSPAAGGVKVLGWGRTTSVGASAVPAVGLDGACSAGSDVASAPVAVDPFAAVPAVGLNGTCSAGSEIASAPVALDTFAATSSNGNVSPFGKELDAELLLLTGSAGAGAGAGTCTSDSTMVPLAEDSIGRESDGATSPKAEEFGGELSVGTAPGRLAALGTAGSGTPVGCCPGGGVAPTTELGANGAPLPTAIGRGSDGAIPAILTPEAEELGGALHGGTAPGRQAALEATGNGAPVGCCPGGVTATAGMGTTGATPPTSGLPGTRAEDGNVKVAESVAPKD